MFRDDDHIVQTGATRHVDEEAVPGLIRQKSDSDHVAC
jgi:hypothetical protein